MNSIFQKQIVKIEYTNWKGVNSIRNIIPQAIYFGSTQYHFNCWLLKAWDIDKDDTRDFKLIDIKFLE